MSAWVKYPFHVRHNGVDYNPGVPISVEDPEACLKNGAVIVEVPQQSESVEPVTAPKAAGKPGRRKAAQ